MTRFTSSTGTADSRGAQGLVNTKPKCKSKAETGFRWKVYRFLKQLRVLRVSMLWETRKPCTAISCGYCVNHLSNQNAADYTRCSLWTYWVFLLSLSYIYSMSECEALCLPTMLKNVIYKYLHTHSITNSRSTVAIKSAMLLHYRLQECSSLKTHAIYTSSIETSYKSHSKVI